MKLIITRTQAKGLLLGRVNFEVRGQVDLTGEETELVTHYKLQNEVLFSKKMVNLWGQPTDVNIEVRLRDLLYMGDSFKCKDLSEVIAFSESLKSACATLKAYLEAARSFGGQETFDF